MELTIKDKTYTFKASFAFMKDVQKKMIRKEEGVELELGFSTLWTYLHTLGDLNALVDLLYSMNINQSPRVTKVALEEYIENLDDVDALIKEVTDFLLKANVSRIQIEKQNLFNPDKVEKEAEAETKA